MTSAARDDARICPHCDATIRGKEDRCWLCGAELTASAVIEPGAPASSEQRVVRQFSLSSLLLIITLAAVVLGATRLAPGLGILLAILTAPALIRTCILVTLRKTRGSPTTTADKVTLFLTSLGGVLVIGVAGGVAFYVTCWGGFLGGAAVSSLWSPGYGPIGWGLVTGALLGGIVGLYVAYLLVRVMWLRKRPSAEDAKGPADERGQNE